MEITIQKLPAYQLRSKFLVFLFEISKPVYKFLFKQKTKAWKTTLSDLAKMQANTLGNDLYIFLTEHGFNIESKLESHDVGHVLLQYPTDVMNEISMQFFYLASGKKSIYTYLTTILGLAILPESYNSFYIAFQHGKTAINFQSWNFEHLLKENTATLRAQIFNQEKENSLFI